MRENRKYVLVGTRLVPACHRWTLHKGLNVGMYLACYDSRLIFQVVKHTLSSYVPYLYLTSCQSSALS